MHWVREPAGKTGCLERRPAEGTAWVQWIEGSLNGKAPVLQAMVELPGPSNTNFQVKLENNSQANPGCSSTAPSPSPTPSIPTEGLSLIELELQPASQTSACM